MVAFGARLTMEGQEQLLGVMTERTIGFVTSIPEFQQLCRTDREEQLRNNLNIVMRMKICSFFNLAFSWVDQLAPLLGTGKVDKLNAKLRSLNVNGMKKTSFWHSVLVRAGGVEAVLHPALPSGMHPGH